MAPQDIWRSSYHLQEYLATRLQKILVYVLLIPCVHFLGFFLYAFFTPLIWIQQRTYFQQWVNHFSFFPFQIFTTGTERRFGTVMVPPLVVTVKMRCG